MTVVVLDLDGVLWRGDEAIPGSPEAVHALRAAGSRVAFLTNNSSFRVGDYVAKFASFGIDAEPADVLTSAQAAAELLQGTLRTGSPVLACAGPGVVEALEHAGFAIVDRGPADAVVVGFHRDFDFDGLDRASSAVRAGARFVATNADPTYLAGGGRVLPGAGSIVAAVAAAAGRSPEVAGKPEPPMVAMVRRRLGDHGVMVGDRPSTDGALATAIGWPFALVLSGIGGHDPAEPIPTPAPAFLADDLAALVPALLDAQHLPG